MDKEAYQKELLRYIYLQQFRAKNPERIDPSCNLYSSYRFYMGETCPADVKNWLDPMLQLFGQTPDQARRNFAQFLQDGRQSGQWQDFYKPRNGVIGTDAFIKTIEQKNAPDLRVPAWRSAQILEELIAHASTTFNLNRVELLSLSQKRELSRVRQAIAYEGHQLGVNAAAIAQIMSRSRSAVHAMIDVAQKNASTELAKLRG